MPEPLLLLEEIGLWSEEGKAVFEGLTWSLARGQKASIRCARGSGATALLRLAAGLENPERGRVVLDGKPFGPYAFDHPFLHRGALGWVPREGGLLVNQTLLDNVALPLRFIRGMARTEALARSADALAEVGLSEAAGHRPHALDPRERWLGALVRASVMAPELWLVDQPPSDLDLRGQASAAAILDRAAASEAAMVVIDSRHGAPQGLGQAIRLEQGRLIPEGA